MAEKVMKQIAIHPDDALYISWALEHGWHWLVAPNGVALLAMPDIPLSFAVEPRLTNAGRTIIGKAMGN